MSIDTTTLYLVATMMAACSLLSAAALSALKVPQTD